MSSHRVGGWEGLTAEIVKGDKKGDKKGDSKGEGKNRSLDNWDQSWFTQGTDLDGQDEGPSACATINRSALRRDALSCTTARSRSLTVRCAAPQTTSRSRALTVRAGSMARDSSLRRKRRPASGGQFQSPHGNSDTAEECKHEKSRPAKAQWTGPTVPLNTPSSPTSPLPVTEVRVFNNNHQCTSTGQILLRHLCRPQCPFVGHTRSI